MRLPAQFADLGAINGRIMSAEPYAALAELVDDNGQKLDEGVRPRVRAGASISSRDYLTALAERERMKAAFSTSIDGIDAVLTPTAMTPAVPVVSIDRPRLSDRTHLAPACATDGGLGAAAPNRSTAE